MPALSHSFRRTAIAGALIALVGVHALLALKEGISNFYAQSAYQALNFGAMSEERLRGGGATQVMQYLTESLRYSPNNAWALEEMGALQVRMARVLTDPIDAFNALMAARSANANLHKALLERPTSPFVWANLALAKLALNELDGELLQALRRADELGPWEPDVQKTVIFASLTAWNLLDPEQQASVVRTMERAARRDAQNVAKIAKSFNRLDLICAINNTQLQVGIGCSTGNNSNKMSNRP